MKARKLNGRVCQLPKCGKILVRSQKKYCTVAHARQAWNQSVRGRMYQQLMASTILQAPEVRKKNARFMSIAKRINNGGLLRCPRCGSRETKRWGKWHGGPKQRAYCNDCHHYFTPGKRRDPLSCVHCGSQQTHKYARRGGIGHCTSCQRWWTIGKDYGTPFTPAMVALLQQARETMLTPDEDAFADAIMEQSGGMRR